MNNQNVGRIKITRNCENCTHLDYYQKDGYEDSSCEGFFCGIREYKTLKQEKDHLKILQLDRYRKRSKKCCLLSQAAIFQTESETL